MGELPEVAHEAHVDELRRLHDAALRLIDSFLDWDLLLKTQVSLLQNESPEGKFLTEDVALNPLGRYGRRLLFDALQAARRAGLLTVLDIYCSKNSLPNFGSELKVQEAHLANDIEANAPIVGSFIHRVIAEGLLSVLSALADFKVLEDLLGDRGGFLVDRIARVQKRHGEAMNEGG